MRLLSFVFFLMLCGVSVAQTATDTVEICPQQQNILCLDEQTPYPLEMAGVNDFEIIYFNRWGEILGKSADKNSYFQKPIEGYTPNGDFEMVVYLIRYETPSGEKKEIQGHVLLTAYCNCG